MRFFLILIGLFILRTIFLPMTIGVGFIDLLYHIFMGLAMGMTALIIDKKILSVNSKKKASIVKEVKKIFKPKKTPEKLGLLHYIKTNEAEYEVYNIDYLEGTVVSVWIERNGESILEEEIADESLGTLGGESFSRFVRSCLNHTRDYIKDNNEIIIEDEKCDDDGSRKVIIEKRKHGIHN